MATTDKIKIAITCDGASDLGDMDVIARTNQVCRVPLLVGARYDVRASAPLTGIEVSDENAEVMFNDDISVSAARSVSEPYQGDWGQSPVPLRDNATGRDDPRPSEAMGRVEGNRTPARASASRTRFARGIPYRAVAWGRSSADFDIDYPLEFFFNRYEDGYRLGVLPVDPGAVLVSVWGGCCSQGIVTNGFAWTCAAMCACGGTAQTLEGVAAWEGYSRGFSCTALCGCGHDAPPPEPVDGESSAASVSASFSTDAIIFEDAYENTPGAWVGRRSSASTLTIHVNGGPNGGTLTAVASNIDKLQKNSGPAFPAAAVKVPAGHSVAYEMNYVGLEASDALEDIVVTATFEENDSTNAPIVSVAKLTAVRIEFTADNAAPANADLHRHVFGVLEEFHYEAYPSDASVDWEFFEGDEYHPPFSPGRMILPSTTNETSNGFCELRAMSGNACFTNSFRFFLPQIVASNPRCNEEFSPVRGEAGWLLLHLTLHVKPFFVSFKGLQMREIPDESGNCPHAGYYNDTVKGGYLSHCEAAGANVINEIRDDGYWATDRCGRAGRYDKPWSDGWKEWPIPIGWGYSNKIMGQYDTPPTTQKFTLKADGTFSIRKFGIGATRDIRNNITIQGGE